MDYNMISKPPCIFLLAFALSASAQFYVASRQLPINQYHQEITYPLQTANVPRSVQFFRSQIPINDDRLKTFQTIPRSSFLLNEVFPQNAAVNLFDKPAPSAASLFTPNTVQQPAETPGQIENYRKALEEEEKEAEKIRNDVTDLSTAALDADVLASNTQAPKSYVDVKFGGDKEYNYGYIA